MKRKLPVDNLLQKSTFNTIPQESISNEKLVTTLSPPIEGDTKPSDLMSRLITKEIKLCSERLDLDYEELEAWLTLQPSIPTKSILHALRIARQYKLDPLQEEVLLAKYKEEWQVSISVDGWIKLVNRHPAFTGLTFTQSNEEIEGVPIWMECTIHRSDRAIPTTIREYMTEVRHETEIWQRMPRRMLRHRVLQQCARVAIGIRLPKLQLGNKEDQEPKNSIDNSIRGYKISQNISNAGQQYGVVGLKIKLGNSIP